MEAKYQKIRHELNELGYYQTFSKDSIHLVDRLLGDLKTTTQSLQKYMKIAQDAIEERDSLQLGAEPYKCDNAKLIKECNELHLSFLQFKEQNEKKQKDLKRQVNRLEQEKEELEEEKDKLRKRITDLELDIVDQGNIISGISKNRPKSSIRSKSTSGTSKKCSVEFCPTMAASDSKIKSLSKIVKELKDSKLKLLDRVQQYENQVSSRDKEIERLMSLVEGGRSIDVLNKECCYKDIDNRSKALHDHIHKLKHENTELENNLKEAINKQHEAMRRALHLAERNKQLEKELKDIDQIALAVEAECNDAVQDKAETVTRLQDRVNESVIMIQNLERENAKLRQDKIELSSDLDAIKMEKIHLQKILDREVEDRKTLTNKLNNFTIIEHDLNMEIDRLVRVSAEHKRRIAELECLISSEKLKPFEYKPPSFPTYQPRDTVDRTSRTDIHEVRQPADRSTGPAEKPEVKRKPSPVKKPLSSHGKQSTGKTTTAYSNKYGAKRDHKPTCKKSSSCATERIEREISTSKVVERTSDARSYDTKQSQAFCGSDSCVKHMRELLDKEMEYRQAQNLQLLETVKQEKEYYMKEYQKLIDDLKNRSFEGQTDKYPELKQQISQLETEIRRLKDENRQVLTGRSQTVYSMESLDSKDMNQRTIKRQEREIEMLRSDLKRLEDERNDLRRRYQEIVDESDKERERVKSAFKEMQSHIDKLEDERKELIIAQVTQRSSVHHLEGNQKTIQEQLRKSEEELRVTKANYHLLKNIHDQSERSVVDLQNQLLRSETDLSNLKMKIKSTDKMNTASETEIAALNSDVHIMKQQLTKLDREKDELLNSLDEKTERIASLEEQLKCKNKNITCLESEINELRKKISMFEDENMQKQGEVRSSRQELSSLHSELDTARKSKEALCRENRRLQDELTSVTLDCKEARTELECAKRQIEDLKTQLQIYVTEIKRTEDLISHKEIERNEILDQFKCLSQEAVVLESNNHSLETEANQNKVQLSVALDHTAELETRIEDLESIIKSYEKQIAELTSQMAYYEIQAKQKGSDQERSADEAKQMRDLCVKMDHEKDNMHREMQRRDDDIMKIQRSLERIRNENKDLQCRLNIDRDNADGLEKLLNEARQDIIQQRLENQDLQREIERFKTDMADMQERLVSTTEQLEIYQDKALDYSQQNKQLRREMADERFSRARDGALSYRDDTKHFPSL